MKAVIQSHVDRLDIKACKDQFLKFAIIIMLRALPPPLPGKTVLRN